MGYQLSLTNFQQGKPAPYKPDHCIILYWGFFLKHISPQIFTSFITENRWVWVESQMEGWFCCQHKKRVFSFAVLHHGIVLCCNFSSMTKYHRFVLWAKLEHSLSFSRLSFLLKARSFLCGYVWRVRAGRKDLLRKPPCSVYFQRCVDKWGGE